MRKVFQKKGMFPVLLATGLLTLAGCTNDDYDLGDVDMTVGIGGDEIGIPVSSTDSIMLSDVLDLTEGGDVKIMSNGDYVFQMAGKNVAAAHPTVDKVKLESHYEKTVDFHFILSSSAKGARAISASGHIDETTDPQEMIHYEGHSDEVESISSVELAPTDITLNISFGNVHSVISTIERMKLTIPGYLDISDGDITTNQSVKTHVAKETDGRSITLENVSTAQNLVMKLNVKRLDFTGVVADSRYGSLVIDADHNITLTGKYNVAIAADWSADSDNLPSDPKITSTVSSDHMIINKATGVINPDINVVIGETAVSGVPDFLTDGTVVADLDNPQIRITIKNDMDVAAKIGGVHNGKQTRIVAMKDGREIASVDLPEINILRGSPEAPVTTSICICRNAAKAVGTFDEIKEIPELSTLIKTIPDAIRVDNVNARADTSQPSTLLFGHTYNVEPNYEVYAPIALGADGRIVYKDTLDNWNSELEDISPYIDKNDQEKNTAVEVSADIASRIPAYLTLSIQPIDTDGKPISDSVIRVTNPATVAASDGKTLATTSVTARMTLMTDDALERLDGIVMTIEGSASNGSETVTGVTLNSKTQKMKVDNIKLKLVGKVVSDLN